MTRIAFFEPLFTPDNQRDWDIRGSYKYPSLLEGLRGVTDGVLLMSRIPPEDDPHRLALERDFGVTFAQIDTFDDPGEHAAEDLFADYCDAIHAHAPDIVSTLNGRMIGFNFALARAAQECGVAFVYRVAGNDIVTRRSVFAERGRPFDGTSLEAGLIAQERFAAQAARTIITMSGTEKARMAALVSDADKIQICRRGVDHVHFMPSDTAPRCANKFLFLGRNSAEKGIDVIEAASDVLAKSHPDISITIAGDFEERDEGNRHYRGYYAYDALSDLYREHDALILPARSEGFPQVVMEGMTCGLPTILSRHLFTHDFAEDGDGVQLIEVDADELAAAMVKLHEDDATYTAMRDAALTVAASEFDARKNAALYRDAMLETRRGAGAVDVPVLPQPASDSPDNQSHEPAIEWADNDAATYRARKHKVYGPILERQNWNIPPNLSLAEAVRATRDGNWAQAISLWRDQLSLPRRRQLAAVCIAEAALASERPAVVDHMAAHIEKAYATLLTGEPREIANATSEPIIDFAIHHFAGRLLIKSLEQAE